MAYSLGEPEPKPPPPVHGFSWIGNEPINFPARVVYGIPELVVSPKNQKAFKKKLSILTKYLRKNNLEQTYLKHQATSLPSASYAPTET